MLRFAFYKKNVHALDVPDPYECIQNDLQYFPSFSSRLLILIKERVSKRKSRYLKGSQEVVMILSMDLFKNLNYTLLECERCFFF